MSAPSKQRRLRTVGITVVGGLLTGLAATVAGAGSASAAGCTTTWISPGSGSWDSASNWSNGVPDAGSYACLPSYGVSYGAVVSGIQHVRGVYVGQQAHLNVQSGPYSGTALFYVGDQGVTNTGVLETSDTQGWGSYVSVDPAASVTNTGTVHIYSSVYWDANFDNQPQGTIESSAWDPVRTAYVRELRNSGRLAVDPSGKFNLGRLDSINTYGELTAGTYDIRDQVTLADPTVVQRVFSNSADVTFTGAGKITDGPGNDVFGLLGTNNVGGVLTYVNDRATFLRPVTNSGDVNLVNSTVRAPGYQQLIGGTQLQQGGDLGGGPVEIDGGTLFGGGTITGDLLNGGRVALADAGNASRLHVTGKYTQTRTGNLVTYFGQNVPCSTGTQAASCLEADGAVQLAGGLGVINTGLQAPPTGHAFTLVKTPVSETGKFSSVGQIIGPPLPAGYGYVPTYGKTVTLKVAKPA